MTSKGHPLLGKWRITSMEFWDAAFIDLLGPGYIRFDADSGGEFAFGAVQGEIDGHPSSESIHFTWDGRDEMDHACEQRRCPSRGRWHPHRREQLPSRR